MDSKNIYMILDRSSDTNRNRALLVEYVHKLAMALRNAPNNSVKETSHTVQLDYFLPHFVGAYPLTIA